MTKQVWGWEESKKNLVRPEEKSFENRQHYVMNDLPDYLSPATLTDCRKDSSTPEREHGRFRVISGRTQRREDLIRNDCHEVDPGSLRHNMKWKERNHRDPGGIIGYKEDYKINRDYKRAKARS